MDDSEKWQQDFRAAPSVFMVIDTDGYTEGVYATREAAELDIAWHIAHGGRRYSVRVEHIHSLDLAQRRWSPPAPVPSRLTDAELDELERLELWDAWPAPWTARTFEIDCPCPNGGGCGNFHTCEEVESREAYPSSPKDPSPEGGGQCVVQIDVPGLESLAGPNARFIAAARNALPRLLAEVRELRDVVAKGTGDVMCGHADEGWEEFPCTRLKGHDGDHETHLRLDPAPDKEKDHE